MLIDLNNVHGNVIDLSDGGAGTLEGPTNINRARASAEVLIDGSVPARAILWSW